MNKIDELLQKIFKSKLDLELKKIKPRIILLGEKTFELLNEEWIESIQQLPWGDTLAYELEKQRKNKKNIFLAEGSLFGLWVIRVNSLEGFKVY
jgi:hypothetical protein